MSKIIGKAKINIGADMKELNSALAQAGAKLKTFAASVQQIGVQIGAIGAGITAPFIAAVKDFSEYGDLIQKSAIRTDMATEALSKFSFAAGRSGTSFDMWLNGVRKMQQAIGEGRLAKEFERFGYAIQDVSGMTTDQQFVAIADAISKIEDPAKRTTVAMKIFGLNGAQLLPLMMEGKKGLDALFQTAVDLGVVFDRDLADAAAELSDLFFDVQTGIRGLGIQLAKSILPQLRALTKSTIEYIQAGIKWAKNNKELLATVFKVGGALAAAGAALAAFGTGIIAVMGFFSAFAASVVALKALFVSFAGVLAALATPLGAIIATVAIVGYTFRDKLTMAVKYVLGFRDSVSKSFGEVKSLFQDLVATIKKGDLSTAWDILKTVAKISFLEIQSAWAGLIANIKNVWAGMARYFAEVWAGMKNVFLDVWYSVQEFIIGSFTRVLENVADVMRRLGLSTSFLDDWKTAGQNIDKYYQEMRDKSNEATAKEMKNIDDEYEARKAANKKAGKDIDARIEEEKKKLEELRNIARETGKVEPDFTKGYDPANYQMPEIKAAASIGGFSARGVALQMGWQTKLTETSSRTANATERIAVLMERKNPLAFN